ncbi:MULTISPECIES: hypothetical protein [Bradyrhizobium]|uniref:hypothetical protein n=1 Tax=Bradyrhizobium TaxID=374 RepID=UPI000406C67F|nr:MULTISPECIES: hypothetical protein [Bradyrhizobium]UFW51160.1 hypothetical protein BaraCB756_09070 [Bradyrhizobium arachidis]
MADCVSPPTHYSAKARIVIDMAFDDAVEPGLLEMDLSVLHDLPAPHLRAYAREMVIAEKFGDGHAGPRQYSWCSRAMIGAEV